MTPRKDSHVKVAPLLQNALVCTNYRELGKESFGICIKQKEATNYQTNQAETAWLSS